MNKEDLRKMLQENLTVDVSLTHAGGYHSGYHNNAFRIELIIKFDGELLTKSRDDISLPGTNET